jgi:predicted phage terminase large subunit-like protein
LTERQGGALFISTPKGFNWFEELYNKSESLDDWERWQLPTKTNPFVPLSELDIAKEEIGTYLYSQEYEAKFVEFTGGIFKEDWIKTYTKETIQFMNNTGYFENRIQYDLGTEKVFDIECQKFATVDLATSTKQTADYTVIACFAKTENNKLILIDMVRERLEGPDIVPKIKQKVNEHGLSYVGIERAGYQLSLIQIARREGLIVKELRPDKDKVSRALPLSAFMEGGSMFLNPTNMHYDDLKRELLQFPESEHDDMVDALAYGVLEIRNKNRYIAY